MGFRILVVGDIGKALLDSEGFQDFVRRTSLQLIIEYVKKVEYAIQIIEEMPAENQHYDLAILDCRSCQGINGSLGNKSFCLSAKDAMPRMPVMHIVANSDNSDMLRHYKDIHLGPFSPGAWEISEQEVSSGKFLDTLKTFLYGKHIEAQMDNIFEAGKSSRRRDVNPYELGRLFHDIAAYWAYLPKNIQEKIQQRIHVDTDVKPVYVGLL